MLAKLSSDLILSLFMLAIANIWNLTKLESLSCCGWVFASVIILDEFSGFSFRFVEITSSPLQTLSPTYRGAVGKEAHVSAEGYMAALWKEWAPHQQPGVWKQCGKIKCSLQKQLGFNRFRYQSNNLLL